MSGVPDCVRRYQHTLNAVALDGAREALEALIDLAATGAAVHVNALLSRMRKSRPLAQVSSPRVAKPAIVIKYAMFLASTASTDKDPALGSSRSIADHMIAVLVRMTEQACSDIIVFVSGDADRAQVGHTAIAWLQQQAVVFAGKPRSSCPGLASRLQPVLDAADAHLRSKTGAFRMPSMPLKGRHVARSTEPQPGMEEVVAVCRAGSADAVQASLRRHCGSTTLEDVHRRCWSTRSHAPGAPKGDSPLAAAVRHSNAAAVELLLQLGADPNEQDCCEEHVSAVQLALTALETLAPRTAPSSSSSSPSFLLSVCKWAEAGEEARVHLATTVLRLLLASAAALPTTSSAAARRLEEDLVAGRAAPAAALAMALLQQASTVPLPGEAFLQLRAKAGIPRLQALHYALVGQRAAKTALINAIDAFFLHNPVGKPPRRGKPLVILMPGAPGLGKTTLSRAVARTLLKPGEGIGQAVHDIKGFVEIRLDVFGGFRQLFGSEMGFHGAGKGLLTNSLLPYDGKPCVVVLDRIDAVTDLETLFGFYNLFNDGYVEHQTGNVGGTGDKKIDCRQHVFIVTTTWGQDLIERWHSTHMAAAAGGSVSDEDLQAEVEVLGEQVKEAVRETILRPLDPKSPPTALAGRFDVVVPFTPLTSDEVNTVALQQLSQLAAMCALPPRDESDTTSSSSSSSSSGGGDDRAPGPRFGSVRVRFGDGLRAVARRAYRPAHGLRDLVHFRQHVSAAVVEAFRAGSFRSSCVVDCRGGAADGTGGKMHIVVEPAEDDGGGDTA